MIKLPTKHYESTIITEKLSNGYNYKIQEFIRGGVSCCILYKSEVDWDVDGAYCWEEISSGFGTYKDAEKYIKNELKKVD